MVILLCTVQGKNLSGLPRYYFAFIWVSIIFEQCVSWISLSLISLYFTIFNCVLYGGRREAKDPPARESPALPF